VTQTTTDVRPVTLEQRTPARKEMHAMCAICHPVPDDATALCGSKIKNSAGPVGSAKVTCVVCADLIPAHTALHVSEPRS